MKQFILRMVDRLVSRALRERPLKRARGDSFDLLETAFLKAAMESADLYERHMLTTPAFATDLDLLSHAVRQAPQHGLILEFGVASGRTITHLASLSSAIVYGFDSFEGLPESWRTEFSKGTFAGDDPAVPGNVTLVKGWFEETLPAFLSTHGGPLSLLHVDCDLYSSTKTIFNLLVERIVPGTVIVFDEYWNYPGWRQHEYRAFEEFKETTKLGGRPIGFVPSHQQVAFVIEKS